MKMEELILLTPLQYIIGAVVFGFSVAFFIAVFRILRGLFDD